MGIGTYGQFIFVSPAAKLVIVRTADEDGIGPGERRQVFRSIAEQINRTYSRDMSPQAKLTAGVTK